MPLCTLAAVQHEVWSPPTDAAADGQGTPAMPINVRQYIIAS